MSKVGAKRPAFTLVELLVSLGIIGVITGAMLANFRGGQRSSELRLASEILVTQLRELQTDALSGKLIGVCTGTGSDNRVCEQGKSPPVTCPAPTTCQKTVPSGYGMDFAAAGGKNYLIFFDTDGDRVRDPGEDYISQPLVSTGQVYLASSSVAMPTDIVFTPPFAQIFVDGSNGGNPVLTLTLKHSADPNLVRNVTVNLVTGKIEHD